MVEQTIFLAFEIIENLSTDITLINVMKYVKLKISEMTLKMSSYKYILDMCVTCLFLRDIFIDDILNRTDSDCS